MNNNLMVCGLLWSGSSAFVDILNGFEETIHVRGELNEFRVFGGIADHLNGTSPKHYRPVLDNYLQQFEEMTEKHFDSDSILRAKAIRFFMEAIANTKIESFDSIAQKKGIGWLEYLKSSYSDNWKTKSFVFDQPIIMARHKELWPTIFNPFKLFYVFRDPRDQLATIMTVGKPHSYETSATIAKYGSGRQALIKHHVDVIKDRYRIICNELNEFGADKVVLIPFEDIVLKHDEYVEYLTDFAELSNFNPENSKFDPSVSCKNIGMYSACLSKEEVDYIEHELMPGYLYISKFFQPF